MILCSFFCIRVIALIDVDFDFNLVFLKLNCELIWEKS